MVHDTSVSRAQCFVTVAALVALVLTVGMFLSKDCVCPTAGTTRGRELNDTTMSTFFQAPVSKASVFLSGSRIVEDHSNEGSLMWTVESDTVSGNLSLIQNGTWISAKEQGIYLLFVQATFKVKNSTDLMLRVDVQYKERTDQVTAIFKTHFKECEGESDVVLSKPVLLWMDSEDNVTVVTNHRELVDYSTNPFPTFLTMFKYSD